MTPPQLTPMTENHQRAVRHLLVTEAARPDPATSVYRGWVAVAAGTVAVTVTAVLATRGASSTPQVPAAPPALSAPERPVTAAVPQPGPGQYLYSTTTGTSGGGTTCGGQGPDTTSVTFVNSYTVQSWHAPGLDGARRLVITYGATRYASPADATLAAASCPDALKAEVVTVTGQNTDVRGHGSTWEDGSSRGGPGPFQQPTGDFLDGLSREPADLLDQLTAANDSRGSAAQTLTNGTDLLGNGVALPVDLRSAAVVALTRIPGATVTDQGARVTVTVTEAATGDSTSATLDRASGLVTAQTDAGSTAVSETRYGVTGDDTTVPVSLS